MRDRPLLYDIYCGAGGAGMGYYRAGFRVIGIDNKPQKHYPFGFIQMDALEFLDRYIAGEFERADAFHASPPCQRYSRLRHLPWLKDKIYWDSIPPTRAMLEKLSCLWVMENVEDAPVEGITLCGQMFGLPIFRHRKFESNILLMQPPHEKHNGVLAHGRATMGKKYRTGQIGIKEISRDSIAGHNGNAKGRTAMGIDWMMTRYELSQSLPPVYTNYIGGYLLKAVLERGVCNE